MHLFYTLATVLQFVNAWLQFYVLNELLDSPLYSLWGPSLLSDLVGGRDWQTTGHFPRVVHCDFNRRRPASVQMDTVLCVLTLNIYYEKLFIFLWFWLLFVAVVSTLNSMKWIYTLCSNSKAQRTIQNYLSTAPLKCSISDEQFFRVLGPDGLFIMEQMALNLGDIPASYLTISMRNICQSWLESDEFDDDEQSPLTGVKSIKHT
uniref:Innexin n=1 Tax=Caenorhabditis japonica TaxID=281687 RepID=A0A8R1E286_CAEJA